MKFFRENCNCFIGKIDVTVLQVNWKAAHVFAYMLKIVLTKNTHWTSIQFQYLLIVVSHYQTAESDSK